MERYLLQKLRTSRVHCFVSWLLLKRECLDENLRLLVPDLAWKLAQKRYGHRPSAVSGLGILHLSSLQPRLLCLGSSVRASSSGNFPRPITCSPSQRSCRPNARRMMPCSLLPLPHLYPNSAEARAAGSDHATRAQTCSAIVADGRRD